MVGDYWEGTGDDLLEQAGAEGGEIEGRKQLQLNGVPDRDHGGYETRCRDPTLAARVTWSNPPRRRTERSTFGGTPRSGRRRRTTDWTRRSEITQGCRE